MAEENFSSIMQNPHFNQFVALLSVPFHSVAWRHHHPKVPYWTLLESLKKAVFGNAALWSQYKQRAFDAFVSLLVTLVEADTRFHYSPEDMDWLIGMLDSEHGQVTFAMMLAAASSRQSYLTPVQAAEVSDIAESTWRNKCASDEVVGAMKAGKQWLIPASTLKMMGYTATIEGKPIEDTEVE